MTMASLAWTLKAWCALMLPVSPRWEAQHEQQRCRLLTMEFRTFRAALIDIPCQIVRTARYIRWRIQAWNPWWASSSASSTPSNTIRDPRSPRAGPPARRQPPKNQPPST